MRAQSESTAAAALMHAVYIGALVSCDVLAWRLRTLAFVRYRPAAAFTLFQITIGVDEAWTLKIVTSNINNINKRLDNLVAWLVKTEPDIILPPGTQAEQRAFRRYPSKLGYGAVWQGERSWNGVAILARDPGSGADSGSSLPGNPQDARRATSRRQ